MDLNTLRKAILNYSKTSAEVNELKMRLDELQEDLSIQAVNYDNDIKNTSRGSVVENMAINLINDKEELQTLLNKKQRQLQRIDNAMNILSEKEYEVIDFLLIQRRNIYSVEKHVERDKKTIRRIEKKALNRMVDLINLKGN